MKNETEERKMGFIGKREVSGCPPLVDAPDRLPLVVAPGRPTLLVTPGRPPLVVMPGRPPLPPPPSVPSSPVNLSRHATCRLLVEHAPHVSAL